MAAHLWLCILEVCLPRARLLHAGHEALRPCAQLAGGPEHAFVLLLLLLLLEARLLKTRLLPWLLRSVLAIWTESALPIGWLLPTRGPLLLRNLLRKLPLAPARGSPGLPLLRATAAWGSWGLWL